jgi:hypothetical protein
MSLMGQALYLFFELGQLLLQPRRPGRKLLRGRLTGGCLPIGGVELAQIARNALLDLRQTPFQLSLREVIVARVHRLELAAVDPTLARIIFCSVVMAVLQSAEAGRYATPTSSAPRLG